MDLVVVCALGNVLVDIESEEVEIDETGAALEREQIETGLPRVLDADRSGALIVAVVERRPPLMVSRDAGLTWSEAGAGLPPGRSVAISPDHPDTVAFAGGERLFLSADGGRFWRALTVELPTIERVAWLPS